MNHPVISAIKARHSTRAFLPKSVPHEHIEAILEAARFAASGKNTQPWHIAVVSGETQKKISDALLAAFRNGEPKRNDYEYYSKDDVDPAFHERAVACGMALYSALKIERGDKARRKEVWEWNYQCFGAPVTFFIFMDRGLAQGSWVDMGLFMQNIMLAASDFDLATCPQAALGEYPDLVRNILGIPFDNKLLLCGISLGYPDNAHPVNQYRTARESVENFAKYYS